jgi:hypothetical protein
MRQFEHEFVCERKVLMRINPFWRKAFIGVAVTVILTVVPSPGETQVTSPKEHFGFNIGDDYHLITYTELTEYWQKINRESDRMVLEEIGKTAEGRPQFMAILTSPDNHKNLSKYKDISRRLALAEGLTDEEARKLAEQGKAVVCIQGGLHATEVVGPHQLAEMVYQMASRTDAETERLLDDVILLALHANPDGMELVSSWYMRQSDPKERYTRDIPRLYHKYVGHDNNRDSYMAAQVETQNTNRILYREWFPQIFYDHHQTGPRGAVLFVPPFRDPFNYNFDPLLPLGIESVGWAVHNRFAAEGKPGAATRREAGYSTWFNGNVRTTGYFHNQIGLLTEINGNPTPEEIVLVPDRQLPHTDLANPIEPQPWHFRQAIDYSVSANRAVMDYASRNRDNLLFNRYLMGKRSIERGSRDNWTIHPKVLDAVNQAVEGDPEAVEHARANRGAVPSKYFELFRKPENKDPRGFILPSDQPDFPTATKFVNTFIYNGVTVHRATKEFQVAGKTYPAGSYVFKTAQAFRPHVMDLFEPQDYPNDFAYEGGPPIAPYDNAGYTLAYQMGIEFDRIMDGFDGPFEKIEGLAEPLPGEVTSARGAAGFVTSHEANDAAIATNRLLAAGDDVYWLSEPVTANGKSYPAGTIYIPAKSSTKGRLDTMASELGLSFEGVGTAPTAGALKLSPVRIGLWDQYGGSMPSGWTRWIFEQFEFPHKVIYPQTLDAGDLESQFDVLVFVTDAIPPGEVNLSPHARLRNGSQPDAASIPEEYRAWLGRVTAEKTVPKLAQFLEAGGTILTIGTSTNLGSHVGLPMVNHLTDGDGTPLPQETYYIPSSVLRVRVDNSRPLAYGLKKHIDIFFNNSPVFRLLPEADEKGLYPVAWFDSGTPLRSGWAWGQHRLFGGVVVAEAEVGEGHLYMFGPEVLFRSQPHGTFKLFFNGIYLGGATETRLGSPATEESN